MCKLQCKCVSIVCRSDKRAPEEGAAKESKATRRGSKAQQEEGGDGPDRDRRRAPEEKKVVRQLCQLSSVNCFSFSCHDAPLVDYYRLCLELLSCVELLLPCLHLILHLLRAPLLQTRLRTTLLLIDNRGTSPRREVTRTVATERGGRTRRPGGVSRQGKARWTQGVVKRVQGRRER